MNEIKRSLRWAKDYDFALTVATVALVVVIGAVFVAGTVYTFFAARANPAWTQSAAYGSYIDSMNAYLFPLLVALVLALGLCIPRRILTRRTLVAASLAMLAVTLVLVPIAGLRIAWIFLLGAAALVQLVVIVLTAARSPRVRYLQEGFLIRMGSAVLHLGFIALVAAFVMPVGTALQLDVFWVATALVMVGMGMSFYSRELSGLRKRELREAAEPEPEEA